MINAKLNQLTELNFVGLKKFTHLNQSLKIKFNLFTKLFPNRVAFKIPNEKEKILFPNVNL
jgi:hypothetical protein